MDRPDGEVPKLAALDDRLDAEPPRTAAFLRFTERYAIPAAVALLEANIRTLEALGGAIRLAQGRDTDGGADEPLRRALDGVVAEVEDAVGGDPTDPEARRLLSEARDLREEIRDRVDVGPEGHAPDPDTTAGTSIPVTEATEEAVDIEAELDTIREQVDSEGQTGSKR